MKYLLDTVVFLWMIFDDSHNMSSKALAVLEDDDNEFYFSSASAWEIAIKYSIGKLNLKKNPVEWLPEVISKMGLIPLSVSQHHALRTIKLPLHHRDLFDRLLISQSLLEKMPIVTPDRMFKKYKATVIW